MENRTVPFSFSAEYKYDPFGRRIEKKITDASGIKTYTYTYDNEDIIMETLTTNNQQMTTKYIHGPGIDEPLAIQHSSADYYYHADALGSITRMTDQNGNIVQTYKYDSFGNITASSILQPYAYTGREYDKETGLYYYRARYYDPRTGRFISKDPIGFGGGDVNLYSYTGQNPVNKTDPLGLWGFGLIGSGSAEGGLGFIGGGTTGSIGGGLFGGGSQGLNLGGLGSFGAFLGGPGYGPSYPGGNAGNAAVGAFVGAGIGGFITNAQCPNQLSGSSTTYSFNVGIGPIKFSAQFGISNGTWIGSVTIGPGIGVSGSGYPTNTWTTK